MKQEVTTLVIDAENAVVGRLASYTAKQLLLGKEIAIVNTEKAIITGSPEKIRDKYLRLRRAGGATIKGPFFPSNPERILKRIIKGMLPMRKGRGKPVLHKVKCYTGIPAEFKESKLIKSNISEPRLKSLTLKQLSQKLKK